VSLFMDKPSDDGGRPAAGGATSARTVIREMRGPVEERVTVLRSALSRSTPQHRSGQVGEASSVLSTCRYLLPSSLLIWRQPTTEAHDPGINSHHASRRRGVNRPFRDGPARRLVIRHRLAPRRWQDGGVIRHHQRNSPKSCNDSLNSQHICVAPRHLERCNREGLPVPAKESCVAEILAQDRKTTCKTGHDRQHESYQPDECEWVRPDGGSGCDSQVVRLRDHAKHGDACQRQHLSGFTPIDPPDPEALSGSPKPRTDYPYILTYAPL
jgi:hypothetical protein